jgi:cobaltochelatase CobS
MPNFKPCIRCKGTGSRYGGTCFRCNGFGREPGSQHPQARAPESAEKLLGLLDDEPDEFAIAGTPDDGPSNGGPNTELLKLKGRLDAAIAQIGSNHVTALTATAKLKSELVTLHAQERTSHAHAISSLEEKIDSLSSSLDEAIKLLEAKREVSITINTPSGSYTVPEGHKHPMFETLLRAASSRQADGYHPNCWIAGPAGSGKTTGGRMLAKALNLPFFFNGAVSMEHKLIGFRDAGGNYHSTPFREGYTIPAVYQFDDVDSSENSALLALNAALANGECDFADKLMPRHPDSIILATANTWGLGATADYVGRVKIDAAFLSRFPVKISWPYDEPFELLIGGNPSWTKRVQAARAAAKKAGLKVIIDPRHSIAGSALIQSGFTPDQAAELTYLANIPADKRNLIQ